MEQMTTAILFMLAFQAGAGPSTSAAQQPRFPADASFAIAPGFVTDQQEENPAFEEREFMQRVNGLSKALNDFAVTYKKGEVDLKKVKAVRKAMHELEKSEWFKPQKAKGQGE
jgi:hypothetical protein